MRECSCDPEGNIAEVRETGIARDKMTCPPGRSVEPGHVCGYQRVGFPPPRRVYAARNNAMTVSRSNGIGVFACRQYVDRKQP